MPTFEITGPDGGKYHVEGPEGATEQDALAQVQAQVGSADQTKADDGKGIARRFVEALPSGLVKGFGAGVETLGNIGATVASHGRMNAFSKQPFHEATERAEKPILEKLPQPSGAAGEYGQTVGEFVGNPLSYVGPGSLALKAGGAVTSALASETAGQFTKGTKAEPYARAGAAVAAGAGAGFASAERQAAKLSAGLPSADAIKQSAKAAYDAIANARLKATQPAVDALASKMMTALDDDLIVSTNAPRTFKAIEKMQQAGGDVAQIMGIRQKLGAITPAEGTEYTAAQHVRHAIDDFIENLQPHEVVTGDPQMTAVLLDHARSSWRPYKELEAIEAAGKTAEHRAGSTGSGANKINTMRQNVRGILDNAKKSRGFSDEAKEKMEEIVMGTWATNMARHASKYAPSGTVSSAFGVLAGEAFGPGVGVGVAGTGLLGRYLGEYLTKRQIRELEDLIRTESPIGRAAASAQQNAKDQIAGTVPGAAIRSGLAATSPLAGGGL